MLSGGGGILVGLTGAAWLSRFIAAMLFDVRAIDPVTFAAVTLLLGITAGAALLVPLRRTFRVSPLTAIRSDA